jgi:hypothetical protein
VNPPAAVQRPDAGPASPPRRRRQAPIIFGALAIVAMFAISHLLATPHYVSQVSFQNSTPYELLVEVSNGHGGGWLPLGTVDRHQSTQFAQVYDVGDDWQFRVWAQGERVGQFRVTQSQLEQSGWRVEIPRRIGDRLAASGVARQP